MFLQPNVSVDEFNSAMKSHGWCVFPDAIPAGLIDSLRADMDAAYLIRRGIQQKNGVDVNTDGTLHHLVDFPSFIDLLREMYCDNFLQSYFDGNYILNSYGGVINMQNKASYVCNIHRDVRTFTGNIHMMLNMLVMVDDFTLDNGATYVLSGSHLNPEKPEDAQFFQKADRVVGKAGSILLFDSNLWHAAGQNQTESVRRALTLTFTKPYMKPQLDYPRYIGYDKGDSLPEGLRQVLGYNARIPVDLNEWYQPPHLRMYRPGQG